MTRKVQGINLIVEVLKQAKAPMEAMEISNKVLENTGLIITCMKVVMLSVKLKHAGLVESTIMQNRRYWEWVHLPEQEASKKLKEVISNTEEMELEIYKEPSLEEIHEEISKYEERHDIDYEESVPILAVFRERDELNKKCKEMVKEIDELLESVETKRIKCPNCNSTNTNKIGTIGRAASIGIFGLASSSIGKTYKCNRCGYKW